MHSSWLTQSHRALGDLCPPRLMPPVGAAATVAAILVAFASWSAGPQPCGGLDADPAEQGLPYEWPRDVRLWVTRWSLLVG